MELVMVLINCNCSSFSLLIFLSSSFLISFFFIVSISALVVGLLFAATLPSSNIARAQVLQGYNNNLEAIVNNNALAYA